MTWKSNLIFHLEEKIIETFFSDRMTSQELKEAITATLEMMRKHQTPLVLADCVKLQQEGHTFVDLTKYIHIVLESEFKDEFREAIIVSQLEDESSVRKTYFWASLAESKNLQVRAFEERDLALEWLVGVE